jgi:hypothetical protein
MQLYARHVHFPISFLTYISTSCITIVSLSSVDRLDHLFITISRFITWHHPCIWAFVVPIFLVNWYQRVFIFLILSYEPFYFVNHFVDHSLTYNFPYLFATSTWASYIPAPMFCLTFCIWWLFDLPGGL